MERNAILILASGADRPGIVERITQQIYESGGNLEDSRMALLGGEFALIVLVTGAEPELRSLEAELPAVAGELDLTLQVKPTVHGRVPAGDALRYRIRAVSMDHPGIVHRLTRILSEHQINVVQLHTSLTPAPGTGTPIFTLELDAEVPASLTLADLRRRLEDAAREENLDLELRAVDARG